MKLLILCRFILLITALIGVFGKKRKTGEKKVVKLGRAEYCWGCQYTVQAMANLTETYFRKVQDLGEQPTAQASEIAERMCDSKYFDRFLPFIRYSCMKILDDHSADFLLQFEGHVKMIRAKNIMYERITSFCGEGIHACPTALPFDKKNSKYENNHNLICSYNILTICFVIYDRTQCDACRVLAVDAESAYKTILGKPTQVIENVCRTLGYYHQPYVWLEEYCDEMMEDYSGVVCVRQLPVQCFYRAWCVCIL